MKIVAAADLHVDSTMVGRWNAEAGMHDTWVESFARVADLVNVSNENSADLLVLSGDVFHTGRPPAEAVAKLTELFAGLDRTKVAVVTGNHDRQTIVGEHRTPLDAYLSSHSWCHSVSSEAEVIDYDGLALAMVPWVRVAGRSAEATASYDLAVTVKNLAEQVGDRPSLLFGHLTVAERSFDSGLRGSEVKMMNTVTEATVPTKVLDEGPWAMARLGHLHRRQELSVKTGYIGSTYKVDWGEHADPKGCDLIEVTDDGLAALTFLPFVTRELVLADVSSSPEGGMSPAVIAGTAKRGDRVRFLLDAEGEPSGFAKALATLAKKGVEVEVRRKPKPVHVSSAIRAVGARLDLTPAAALGLYLRDVRKYDEITSAALEDEFATIVALAS